MHVLIAGAGIAGVSAAHALVRFGHTVTLVEPDRVGSGATGVAAGLVNPFMGPKAVPVWRHALAYDALWGLLDAAGATLRPGLIRPARDVRQAQAFQARAAEYPAALTWLRAEDVAERWPGLKAPHGALDVHGGGMWTDPATGLARVVAALEATGALRRVKGAVTGWGEDGAGAWAEVNGLERLAADRLVLALGAGLAAFPVFDALGLHAVKGEVHEATCPGADALPAIAAGAYAVPAGPDCVLLGGTYEHAFTDLLPTNAARQTLHERLARFIRALDPQLVGAAWTGVRINAPNRLPRVGPLPGYARVWTFTGLGSKGLLLAPLLAAYLPGWLAAPETIPADVRTL